MFVHVHVMTFPPPLTCCRETNQVGHGAAGDDDAGPVMWKLEKLAQPLQTLQFHADAHRGGDPGVGDGLESRCNQVCTVRRWRASTNDKVKTFGATRVGTGLPVQFDQLVQRRGDAETGIRKRFVENGERIVRLLGEGHAIVNGLDRLS